MTLELVHMRASQINGCNAVFAAGIGPAESAGVGAESAARVAGVARIGGLRQCRTVSLRARRGDDALADHPDVVTDEIWAEAAEHYDEAGLSALVSMIALTNFFNRVNTTLRVQPGSWG